LYDEPSVPEIQIEQLAKFLKEIFPVKVETRENILKCASNDIAFKIAQCKIFHLVKDFEIHNPSNEEIEFEKLNFHDTSQTENIIMYDGFELQKIISSLISKTEDTDKILHVVFTNKLTCTYDCNDYRYHGRALIGSNPSIISTTGIIEAPAKPREYYFDLMTNFTQGVNVETIKEKYKGAYLEYHDSRLSKIIEGYLLQTIFYYETGEPFCENLECRLFNAHWQKDLLYSQLKIRKLCKKHQNILLSIISDQN